MLRGSFSAFFLAFVAGVVLIITAWRGDAPAPALRQVEQAAPETAKRIVGQTGVLPENANLRMNAAGLKIIKDSEGLRTEAYNLNGQWLIGYGHARTAGPGMVISEKRAEELLRDDVRDFEEGVKKALTVAVNENEFSAMVSLAYNLGIGGFRRTSVLERINAGDRQGAADAFLNHDRATINGVRQSIPHLTHRREKERALFLTQA